MAKVKVSFSIVTYNDELYIEKLLGSIFKNTKVDFHGYIIDNNSMDGTVEIVKNSGYDITLIENKQNDGFGAAHNKVLSMIDSSYHVFVNPDIQFGTSVIDEMVAYIEKERTIGILVPKVLSLDGSVQLLPKRDPKFVYLLSRRLRCKLFDKYRALYEMREKNEDETYDIEFASGCFMFVRTELLIKVGGFDERYFLYFEDADFSREIRKYASIQYNPNFIVSHHWDRAGAKSFKYFMIQVLSMIKYFWKWRHHGSENEI